jgi:hypothetical protein
MRTMADLGRRETLEGGELHAYVIEAGSRRALLGLLARAVAGSLERAEGWCEWAAERFTPEAGRDHLDAVIDGEPVVLPAPLELEGQAARSACAASPAAGVTGTWVRPAESAHWTSHQAPSANAKPARMSTT